MFIRLYSGDLLKVLYVLLARIDSALCCPRYFRSTSDDKIRRRVVINRHRRVN